MRKFRACIVDDEKPARERIDDLLSEEERVEVAGICKSGQGAIQALRAEQPDLLFLDVQMPEVGGFEVLESVGVDDMPVTIFVTAYDRYALRAFDAHAIDYLLKPYSNERFKRALERACLHVEAQEADHLKTRLSALLKAHQPDKTTSTMAPRFLDRLAVKRKERIVIVKGQDIRWIEAAGKYVRLHLQGKTYLHREKIGWLEEHLDPRQFVRIHRSTIVNLECVTELLPDSHGEFTVVLDDGTQLKLSRTYRSNLQDRLRHQL